MRSERFTYIRDKARFIEQFATHKQAAEDWKIKHLIVEAIYELESFYSDTKELVDSIFKMDNMVNTEACKKNNPKLLQEWEKVGNYALNTALKGLECVEKGMKALNYYDYEQPKIKKAEIKQYKQRINDALHPNPKWADDERISREIQESEREAKLGNTSEEF